jgi:hypothetical protein
MKLRRFVILAATGLAFAAAASAQSVLFDFDNAPVHTSLPISLTAGGITAQFTATGQGFSVQPANSLGFTPAGFAGYCIYPNSVYAADLSVTFSQSLTAFSILYAPEEYACDSSATMRVTAYLDGTLVGTATTNAVAGTWPSETLAFASSRGFNKVVVHYDAPPVTGGDWGPIFMADNMVVTPAPPPIVLVPVGWGPGGGFAFSFTNSPGGSFTVLAATNATLSVAKWTVLGTANEIAPGQYQFTDLSAASIGQQFYCVRSP